MSLCVLPSQPKLHQIGEGTELCEARSADGTEVPFTCLRMQSASSTDGAGTANADVPTLVYAYGGATGQSSDEFCKAALSTWVTCRRNIY